LDYSFSSHTFFDCACHTYASEKRANGLRQVDFRLRLSSLSVPISATINSFVVIATSQSLIVSLAWMLLGGLTAWLSGSGGDCKTRSHYRAISGKTRAVRERRSRCPLEPVLAGFYSQYSLEFKGSGQMLLQFRSKLQVVYISKYLISELQEVRKSLMGQYECSPILDCPYNQ